MCESLNDVLKELGYTTKPSTTQGRKRIFKGEQFVNIMSASQVWEFLKIYHPEIFKFEVEQ